MKWFAPWVSIPLWQCAAHGCNEPRVLQGHPRLVAKDNPEEIGRRFCIRHAFEYDRAILTTEAQAEIVELFPRRAA